MRKYILIVVLVLVGILAFASMACAASPEGDFEFDSATGTITGYTGLGGDVEIPSTIGGVDVTSIGNEAFRGKASIISITIPDSVTEIGSAVFNGTSITSITIPKNVVVMGSAGSPVFGTFPGLTTVVFADGMTKIPDNALRGSIRYLTSVTIPSTVTEIGSHAFYACTDLTSIILPDSLITIGDNAFSGCIGLTSITIPDSVTTVGELAFYNCTSLTSITIPASITEIGAAAFTGCPSLATGIFADGMTKIPDNAFSGCTSLTSVTIPDTVTEIGIGAFQGCTGLTSITIPKNVISMGNNSSPFIGCTNLTTVTFADGMTRIPDFTLSGCTGLTSVTIPSTVTEIGAYAFKDCTNLTSVTIPKNVISMGNYSSPFEGCTSLDTVIFADGIVKIPNYALQNCTSLTSVTIPDTVTEIGSHAFSYCTSLTSVTIPNGVIKISNYAFDSCSNLANITIPNSVTVISVGAFYGCNSLTSITIPDSVTTVDELAFYNCTSLTSVTIPDSVTKIGYNAFYGCDNLLNVIFENENTVSLEPSSILNLSEQVSLTITLGLVNNTLAIYDNSNTFPAQAVIEAHNGSPAQTYAEKYDRTFEAIPDEDIVWSSDDSSIAEVNQDGVVTAISPGTTNIRATTAVSGNIGVCQVQVLSTHTVTWENYDGTELEQDLNVSYGATPSYDGDIPTREATLQYTYSFTGWTPAIDTVTSDITYTANFTTIPNPVQGLNITLNPISLTVGGTYQVTAILHYINGTTEDVTNVTNWNISSGGVATINNTGLLQGIAPGECELEGIYSYWDNTELISYSNTVQVIVVAPEPEPEPDSPSAGASNSDTTTLIKPQELELSMPEPVEPVIEPSTDQLELHDNFVARVANSTSITDAIAVSELTTDNTILIPAEKIIEEGKELRAYYYNTDKQKWVALASYTSQDQVEFLGDVEGYVAVFAVEQPTFTDLQPKTDIEATVNRLNGLALIEGYPADTDTRSFKPDQPITGVEFAAIQARLLGMVLSGQQKMYDILPVYQSVADTVWYVPYIQALKPLLPATEGQIVTKNQAVNSVDELQKIIETETDDEFTGQLNIPENQVITRADAAKLILSLI